MNTDQTQELREIILEMKHDIERIAERQSEMNENLKKIKEAIYNPDEGLYARIKALESWKESSQRFIWLIASTVAALGVNTIYKFFVN
jgi:chromosome segregation ATPase